MHSYIWYSSIKTYPSCSSLVNAVGKNTPQVILGTSVTNADTAYVPSVSHTIVVVTEVATNAANARSGR